MKINLTSWKNFFFIVIAILILSITCIAGCEKVSKLNTRNIVLEGKIYLQDCDYCTTGNYRSDCKVYAGIVPYGAELKGMDIPELCDYRNKRVEIKGDLVSISTKNDCDDGVSGVESQMATACGNDKIRFYTSKHEFTIEKINIIG